MTTNVHADLRIELSTRNEIVTYITLPKLKEMGVANAEIGLRYKVHVVKMYANGAFREIEFFDPISALIHSQKVLTMWHNILVQMEKDTKKSINDAKKAAGIIG